MMKTNSVANVRMLVLNTILIAFVLISASCVHARNKESADVQYLLQQPVHLDATIPAGSDLLQEARAYSLGTAVPFCIEFLHGHKPADQKKWCLDKPIPQGTYSIRAALQNLQRSGADITWKAVGKAIFVIIRAAPGIEDPLDVKVKTDYDGTMSIYRWIDWLYHQEPSTGFVIWPDDDIVVGSNDYPDLVPYHVTKGATMRSIFAGIAVAGNGFWYFGVTKNNFTLIRVLQPDGSVPPITPEQREKINARPTGDQNGRTEVSYSRLLTKNDPPPRLSP